MCVHRRGIPRRVLRRVCALCSTILTVPPVPRVQAGMYSHHTLTQLTRGPLQSRTRRQWLPAQGQPGGAVPGAVLPGVTNPQVQR